MMIVCVYTYLSRYKCVVVCTCDVYMWCDVYVCCGVYMCCDVYMCVVMCTFVL